MSDTNREFLSLLLFCLLGCLAFAIIGASWERFKFRVEAVSRGHAEWIVATNGSTTFKWK